MSDAPKQRVALVIGSGGLKCAAALGTWRRLTEAGIGIDFVVGCSGGAIFGALVALGFAPEQAVKTAMLAWKSDVTSQVNYRDIAEMALPKWLKFSERFGIFRDAPILRGFEAAYGKFTMFEHTRIPFHVVCTDLLTGEPVVITRGRLVDAVRASAGIPLLFEPREVDGRLLVDGALSDPLPVDVAVRAGADLIIAVGFETPPQKDVRTVGAYAMQMFSNMTNQLLAYQFASASLMHHAEIITIVPPFEYNIGLNDVAKIPFIIEQGALAVEPHLDYLKRLLG
ncbi:MAG: patatin-like phospholipase family protein [Anaerolineae bacterium]|nr:MAG: patatin-like phospholipase family protein [Anaerolineae bacterium]